MHEIADDRRPHHHLDKVVVDRAVHRAFGRQFDVLGAADIPFHLPVDDRHRHINLAFHPAGLHHPNHGVGVVLGADVALHLAFDDQLTGEPDIAFDLGDLGDEGVGHADD